MNEEMTDIDLLVWTEKRFGMTKTFKSNPSNEQVSEITDELIRILNKTKRDLGIESPIPLVRLWVMNTQVKFSFFDRKTGLRVLLGEWLTGKDGRSGYYGQHEYR